MIGKLASEKYNTNQTKILHTTYNKDEKKEDN